MTNINDQVLLSREEIRFRLRRMVRVKHLVRIHEVTHLAIARFLNVSQPYLFNVMKGVMPITDEAQVRLSQVFTLIDQGLLKPQKVSKHKTLVRVSPDKAVRPIPRPYVDLDKAKLRWG